MEAVGGMLILRETVDGTNERHRFGAEQWRLRLRRCAVGRRHVARGTFTSDLKDPASALEVTANGGTLDGTGDGRRSPRVPQAVVSGTFDDDREA